MLGNGDLTARTSRLFAADCAERVADIYAVHYPNETRVRDAIEAARLYADGKILLGDLLCAWQYAIDGASKAYPTSAWCALGAASFAAATWLPAGRAAYYAAGNAIDAIAESLDREPDDRAAAVVDERLWQIGRRAFYANGGERSR